jgi:hypothetical protein
MFIQFHSYVAYATFIHNYEVKLNGTTFYLCQIPGNAACTCSGKWLSANFNQHKMLVRCKSPLIYNTSCQLVTAHVYCALPQVDARKMDYQQK